MRMAARVRCNLLPPPPRPAIYISHITGAPRKEPTHISFNSREHAIVSRARSSRLRAATTKQCFPRLYYLLLRHGANECACQQQMHTLPSITINREKPWGSNLQQMPRIKSSFYLSHAIRVSDRTGAANARQRRPHDTYAHTRIICGLRRFRTSWKPAGRPGPRVE